MDTNDTRKLIADLTADNTDGSRTEYIEWLKSTLGTEIETTDTPKAGIRWIDGATGESTFQVAEVEVDSDGNVNLKF